MRVVDDIPFVPVEGYVLCEFPIAPRTEGGLALPDGSETTENEPVRWKVLRVGPGEVMDGGLRRDMSWIEEGEYYYFNFPSYALTNRLTIKGKRYILAQAKFICGRAL